MTHSYDVVILGAGAAGLMCGIEAAKRGRSVLILDKAKKPAEKIRISGGGRCNFTNLHCTPNNFISNNPHFCKSALKRFTQQDFISIVNAHDIAWHEKTLGQLFCDKSAQDIINMLLKLYSGDLKLEAQINEIEGHSKEEGGYCVKTNHGDYECASLVVATGGPSIPKMGSTDFGHQIARQFHIKNIQPTAALVPLTFDEDLLRETKDLSGISMNARVSCGKRSFEEGLLFTHKGLSGPSILQISSYWNKGDELVVNLCPDKDILSILKTARQEHPKQEIFTVLSQHLPKRLVTFILQDFNCPQKIAETSDKLLVKIAARISDWRIVPKGTEGYRTAEVTRGGVDTNELSSKTFEAKKREGLYFIGEVVDVTGHLGGFNFQWAWSSGWCAGQYV